MQLIRRDQYGRIVSPCYKIAAREGGGGRDATLMWGWFKVGVPYIRRWILRDIPLPILMLQKGMAVVYESAGGEYGKWGIEEMKRIEQIAKYVFNQPLFRLGHPSRFDLISHPQRRQKKVGLWALPPSESPAEYKRRYRVGEEAPASSSVVGQTTTKGGRANWLRRVFSSENWRGPLHR